MYQDELWRQRLEINNVENGHNRHNAAITGAYTLFYEFIY